MIEIERVAIQVTEDNIKSVTCDRCKEKRARDKMMNQEYLKFSYEGGFFSEYPGDLNRIEFELCERCMEELFGGFARVYDMLNRRYLHNDNEVLVDGLIR